MSSDFDPYYKWLGIPPKDQPPNYYRLLGVELFEPDMNIIASAANQRYVYIHSFHSSENTEVVQKILDEITVAGHSLLNRQKKNDYDRKLKGRMSETNMEQSDSQPESMSFLEPVKISKILKTKKTKPQIQIGPTIFGILLIAGIIAAACSIYKNMRNISDGATANNTKSRIESSPIKLADTHGEKIKSNNSPPIPKNPAINKVPKTNLPPLPAKPNNEPVLPENDIELQQQLGGVPLPEKNLEEIDISKLFKLDIFDIDVNLVVEELKKAQERIIILHYPDTKVFAMTAHTMGVLDGVCIAFHKNNIPMTYAAYQDGVRDGFVKTWNETGENVYWCQYNKGKRHGLCCYFKDDQLQLVLLMANNSTQSITLVSNGYKKKTFTSVDEAEKDKKTHLLYSELVELEKEIKINEKQFKEQIRDEDQRLRQERASAQNQQNRNAIQARIDQRRSVDLQSIYNNINRALQMSQPARLIIIKKK